MRTNLKTLSLLSLIAFANPVLAQETAATDEPADQSTEQPTENATPPGGDLDLGTPVGPQIGEPYDAEVFDDWTLRCIKAEEGADPCQLYQLLNDEEGNPVAEITMFPLPEGSRAAAGANIVAPLETYLPGQLTLTVDGGNARQFPFTFCSARPFSPFLSFGCVSRVGFSADNVAQFKRGNAATLTLRPAASPDTEIKLNISLTGFTAAMDRTAEQ
ncbi:invasion associated locus B family protein [Aestuariibius sp. HNIBRBA575]|uniref:invasion associated locus B family protein n=1 Tax=Aestuariibius sp. HNIBRBA575 TaxID=3233343 RepID=UPI0034A1BEDA